MMLLRHITTLRHNTCQSAERNIIIILIIVLLLLGMHTVLFNKVQIAFQLVTFKSIYSRLRKERWQYFT